LKEIVEANVIIESWSVAGRPNED